MKNLIVGKNYVSSHGRIVTFLGLQDNPVFGFFSSGEDTFFGLHLTLIEKEAI